MKQPDFSVGRQAEFALKSATTSREYYVSLPTRRETLNQPLFLS
jgi:hypothetical protein